MEAPNPLPSASLLGVRIHRLTLDQAVRALLELMRAGGAHQVVTLNGAMLAQVSTDSDLRELVNAASLVTADGMGVLLAGRILGIRFPERIPGIDLIMRLCEAGAAHPIRVFLLGARPGIAAAAGGNLMQRYHGVEVVGTHHGYFDLGEEAGVIQQIRTAEPDVLLVAMGFPLQDQWIAAHREELGASICIGVGGTLDVLAGRVRRAPRWMQRAGLEWAYRLGREPGRWRTAATLPRLVWLAAKERLVRGKKEVHRGY